jgi:predicted nucleic acid-binding protein
MKTYLDSSVLINIFVNDDSIAQRAYSVLNDLNRTLMVSDYVKLEVLPKMYYNAYFEQALFCVEIFRNAEFIRSSDAIIAKADNIATKYGLSAMDALHAACAIVCGADELVTFEKPSKPFFRIPREELAIVSLYGRK